VSSLAPDSTLATPNRTLIGAFEDNVVVSNSNTTRTISGTHSRLSKQILQGSDGETALAEIPRPDATVAQVVDVAEKLHGARLLYVADRLSALDCANRH
jgi:hypothetical protein